MWPSPGRVSCLQCAKCCTYVAVGINPPTTPKLATEILWHLYHHGVSVCRDEAGEWYVQFEARCKNLGAGNLCEVYLNRPHICRAYDDQSCEVNAPQPGPHRVQGAAGQFLEYLSAISGPKVYQAIAKKYVPPGHQPIVPSLQGRGPGPNPAETSAIPRFAERILLMTQAPPDLILRSPSAARSFASRLIVGTGKYPSFEIMRAAHEASGADMVTVAVRRVDLSAPKGPPAPCSTSSIRRRSSSCPIPRLATPLMRRCAPRGLAAKPDCRNG